MDTYLQKSIQDLEFVTVTKQLSARCNTELGKSKAHALEPLVEEAEILRLLGETSEYLSSFDNNNRIPNHGFDSIKGELDLLRVENTTLELSGFRRIRHLCLTVGEHKKFFKKFREYYPLLFEFTESVELLGEIPEMIDGIIDKFGNVKDSASPELNRIRQEMVLVRGKINQSFGTALNTYQASDFLDEIRESIVDNRRVLAVKSMYRRKVKGAVLGTSKTGSIVYIEPEAVSRYSRTLNNLEFDEKEEVQRILNALTSQIRPFRADLRDYQNFLADMDVTAAKAKYALDTRAIKPEINHTRKLFLRDAYHPLLYLSNKKDKRPTFPQTIELHPENRIIVISGPNAGGKSITLKTIGLLQLMLQSGMLIPVHERSSFCLFKTILTDIGDNQSIENHLSTYSYRLKNMKNFLKKCNGETLFLIDEFGTGSDPELGGALAEAFLEVFYEREAYGVITTHYANLKALANELPCATNANMLFDSTSLQPTFQLELGQPGSSFTFEVAQKNGIPYSLINKAKKKVEKGKIRFDATIAKLQKERTKMARTGNRLQEEEIKAREEAEKLEKLNAKIKTKLENYQELYDFNQRMIYLGEKVNKIAEKYFRDKKKRPLISEFLRLVETENSKRKKRSAKEVEEQETKKEVVSRELEKEVKTIRKKKEKVKKKEEEKARSKPRPVFRVGDRVRLFDGKAVGSIDSLEKNKAVVNYGMFTTNVSIDQLELVEGKK
ncbi:DNA mismatch repair protein MutS2 [Muriicola jejuensis]|uniref:DNA mismatch repair protein MutS n=1 Tax=Muriicola jejuensis TaxID=504488 RepID=A0A6P0UHQ2_9FLAO|nr:DNA mismatch repair protein MutS [Muriicola jejuensis]NER11348.1 DNA mismatch repair protein MutS [Muriicola jejuensis]SMP21213.1 DNA mismatch repair protein MutS2 [Muriicola jejuensis]